MSVLKPFITITVIAGATYVAYVYRDRIRKFILEMKDKLSQKEPEQPAPDPIQEVCKAFLPYANRFEGLYEPLVKASLATISEERAGNVLEEWRIRFSGIGPSAPSCLKSWWVSVAGAHGLTPQERAGRILDMVFSCNIVRDGKKEFTAAADTILYYQEAGGKAWKEGDRLRVESPCWYVPGEPVRILEKGFCEII